MHALQSALSMALSAETIKCEQFIYLFDLSKFVRPSCSTGHTDMLTSNSSPNIEKCCS